MEQPKLLKKSRKVIQISPICKTASPYLNYKRNFKNRRNKHTKRYNKYKKIKKFKKNLSPAKNHKRLDHARKIRKKRTQRRTHLHSPYTATSPPKVIKISSYPLKTTLTCNNRVNQSCPPRRTHLKHPTRKTALPKVIQTTTSHSTTHTTARPSHVKKHTQKHNTNTKIQIAQQISHIKQKPWPSINNQIIHITYLSPNAAKPSTHTIHHTPKIIQAQTTPNLRTNVKLNKYKWNKYESSQTLTLYTGKKRRADSATPPTSKKQTGTANAKPSAARPQLNPPPTTTTTTTTTTSTPPATAQQQPPPAQAAQQHIDLDNYQPGGSAVEGNLAQPANNQNQEEEQVDPTFLDMDGNVISVAEY